MEAGSPPGGEDPVLSTVLGVRARCQAQLFKGYRGSAGLRTGPTWGGGRGLPLSFGSRRAGLLGWDHPCKLGGFAFSHCQGVRATPRWPGHASTACGPTVVSSPASAVRAIRQPGRQQGLQAVVHCSAVRWLLAVLGGCWSGAARPEEAAAVTGGLSHWLHLRCHRVTEAGAVVVISFT